MTYPHGVPMACTNRAPRGRAGYGGEDARRRHAREMEVLNAAKCPSCKHSMGEHTELRGEWGWLGGIVGGELVYTEHPLRRPLWFVCQREGCGLGHCEGVQL